MSKELWDRYAKIWSSDENTREKELPACLTSDVIYRDPNIVVSGFEEFTKYMGDFQNGYPDCFFQIEKVRTHHDRQLANWNLMKKDGEVLMNGTSFAVVSSDNKFIELNGFFEQEPQ